MEHSNTIHGTDENRGVMDRVKQSAAAQLSSQKDRATDGLGSLATAVRKSSEPLRESHQDTIAEYVERAADQIERFSTSLRQRDVSEIVGDAQRFARRQPALFIGGAFAVGVLAARFLKSSSENRSSSEDRSRGWQRYDAPTAPALDRTRTLAPGYSGGTGYGSGGL